MNAEQTAIWRVPSLEGVEAFKARFTRFSYARHTHDGYALGTVYDGAMRFWHGNANHLAAAGAVIVINPAEVHDGHAGSRSGCSYRMIYVERAAVEHWMADDAPRIRSTFALDGPTLIDAQTAQRMRRFHEAIEPGPRGCALEQQSRLLDLLHLLFSNHSLPRVASLAERPENDCVARAKRYLADRIAQPVRLTELAAAVTLSPFYFLRVFKRSTGMPPHAYLNELRLKRARELLRNGHAPADVAAASGFSDQSHLTRRFKQAFGVTPGRYAAG